MKVLFCSNTFEHIHHGPAKFANLILEINDWDLEDTEIRILTEDVKTPQKYLYKAEMKWKNKFPPLGMLLKIIDYYQNAKKIHKEYPFDVIVFNYGMIGLLSAIKFKDIKVIGMINDDNSTSISIMKPKFNAYWVRYIIFKFFERWSAKVLNLIIANSDAIKKSIEEAYKVPKSKVVKLYKSISLQNVLQNAPIKEINIDSRINILFVKSDFKRGALAVLCAALGQLPQYQFRLTVVGPKQSTLPTIQKMITSDRIILNFVSKQPQEEVYRLLKEEAHIFCVPSLKEGLGVANMEALAHKVPVVSTNVGGIPEVLNYGKNGWLSKTNDSKDLANTLEQCITNNTERVEKIEEGYTFIKEKFNHNIMLQSFSSILKSVHHTN